MDDVETCWRRVINKQMTPDQFVEVIKSMQDAMVAIFSNENLSYPGSAGMWNPGGLRGLLRVELHPYREMRKAFDQDPIRSFFEYIVDMTLEQLKQHQHDEQAYRKVMIEVYRIGIDKLMGVGKRVVQPPPEELKMPSFGAD